MDALLAFDEDTLLTGCQDGLIRIIGVLPNQMLGVVGEHGDYPVERLALSGVLAKSAWVLPACTAFLQHFPGLLDRPSVASCLAFASEL